MKIPSAIFLLLLVYAHIVGDPQRLADRPLSLFRDHDRAWLGYSLFVALLLVGVFYAVSLARCRRWGQVTVASLAVLLLLAVAATPSWGELHLTCSLLLLVLLFAHYGLLLYFAESFWLVAHLAVPVGLAVATRFHSYGIWQKGFVVYFVIAAVIHHHLQLRPRAWPEGRMGTNKPRRTYRLKLQPDWRRREAENSSSTDRSR